MLVKPYGKTSFNNRPTLCKIMNDRYIPKCIGKYGRQLENILSREK